MLKQVFVALALVLLASCSSGSGKVVMGSDGGGDAGADVPAEVLPDVTEVPPDVPDAGPQPDAAELDAGADEAAAGCQGKGCFGDKCKDKSDCQSGWCVEHMGDGVCSMECEEECPAGYSCKQATSGPDLVYVCVSNVANLCRPCAANADCKSAAGIEDVCVSYAAAGSFCGGQCSETQPCPWGFSCKPVKSADGVDTVQCVSDTGECPCTSKSVELALWTPCQSANEWGTCAGKRACTAEGLSACDAAQAAQEVCNGTDDDCDGDVDEGIDARGNPKNLCDDGNDCSKDTCVGAGGCEHEALSGVECKDGNVCTVADACKEGICVGSPVTCNDDNPCTDDLCDGTGGCSFVPNAADCDDGEPCTLGDTCKQALCVGEPVACDCAADGDCAALEDGDLCNGTLVCDTGKIPFQCKVDPDTVVTCPEPAGPDAPCLVPSCEPATGACGFAPAHEGYPCQNDNLCTAGDSCQAGKCMDGPAIPCGDGNVCTDDSCLPGKGCIHDANTLPCSDGNVCTTADLCIQTKCVGGPALACDDGNVCTDDVCDPDKGCLHPPNAAACDDGNACTGGDLCAGGKCTFAAAVDCDDKNPCTLDQCDVVLGCYHNPADLPCSDLNPCTLNDTCKAGKCVPGPLVSCDDGNVCTEDECGPTGQCKHAANVLPCDDGNACTTGDVCAGGVCKSAGMLSCDDGSPCTDDACKPAAGCVHTLNTAACDDGDPCSVGDVCAKGICVPGPAQDCDDDNPCTADLCDAAGICKHAPADAACDDGNACTTGDHCQQGKCSFAGIASCDDGNACTDDACNPESGCLHTPNLNPCEDGNVCTLADKCQAGKCQPGKPMPCADGNPCTDDSCDPAQGCVATPNAAGCSDGNACTQNDSCQAGKCVPGAPASCDDGNVCTSDSCDGGLGCQHKANTLPCDDKDQCTLGDTCANTVCKGTGTLACDDGNVCTSDGCDPATGCVFTANAAPCNDGNACTLSDLCAAGKCTGTGSPNCDDANTCTNDACAPATGCTHTNVPDGTACQGGNGWACFSGQCKQGNPNLVLYYSFEEGAGTVLDHGVSGSQQNGTFNGSAGYQAGGKIGNWCMQATGNADSRLAISGTLSDLDMNVPYTFMAWIKVTVTGQRGLIMLGSCCSPRDGYTMNLQSGGTIRFWGGAATDDNNYNTYSNKTVTDGQWHHVGIRVKSCTTEILIDGVVNVTNNECNIPNKLTNCPFDNTNALRIPNLGGYAIDNNGGATVLIDEVRVYKAYLEGADYTAAMNGI